MSLSIFYIRVAHSSKHATRRLQIYLSLFIVIVCFLTGNACVTTKHHIFDSPELIPTPIAIDYSGRCSDWNVVIITIDALRADYLGCYGHKLPTSPVIDGIAQSGIRLTNGFSQAPHTHPAIASLMTGTYPFRHQSQIGHRSLDLWNVTLAEVLQKQGYTTGAFVFNYWLSEALGFSQGFDEYHYLDQQISNPSVEMDIEKWLLLNTDSPFFLWLHYLEPHAPYDPHTEYLDEFLPGYHEPLYSFTNDMLLKKRNARELLSRNELTYIQACYESEIRYVDASIGRVLDILERLQIKDNTLLIILADHGEEFQEHGSLGHDHSLYNELLQVPIILCASGVIPENTEMSSIVQTIDIFPSIVDILGIPRQPTVQGKTFFSGSIAENPSGFAYAQRYFIEPTSHLVSFINPPWKMILNVDNIKEGDFNHWAPNEKNSRVRLYNLNQDPNEKKDVARKHPKIVIELIDRIRRLLVDNHHGPELSRRGNEVLGEATKDEIDETTKEKLRSLGYAL